MKRIVEETGSSPLEALLGEYVQVWCLNYIYAGKLVGVNEHDIILTEAGVVYETGGLKATKFTSFEPVASPELYIRTAVIESYSLAPQLVLP